MNTLHRDERGIALASAIFLGVVMVMITAVMITRALGQSDADYASREFDQALHVAEGGLDFGITSLNVDDTFTTGHLAAQFTDKEAVVALADAMPDTAVVSTPDGDFVLLVAADAQLMLSVGYVPSRDATERFIRVVKSGVQQFAYVMGGALTMGGDTKLKGKEPGKKGDIEFFGDPGVVRINGELEFDWKKEVWQGCVTATGIKDDDYIGPYSNELGDHCPDADRVEAAPIPELNPRPFFKSAHYVICPDGVHYGPGGSTTDMYGWTKSDPRGGPTETIPAGMYGPNIDYAQLNDPKKGDSYADKLTMAEM
ncbi:MAG: hypothetical protein KJN71_07940, partial [Acidimicrobiia bacterium]|nr:hypothetical protein [Acidimicrobiia bacterium]